MIMEINYEALGLKIKNLRESQPKKMGREKLGEHVGVTGTTIYRWENGEGKPELEHILKVCEYFRVTIYQVLDVPNRSDLVSSITSKLHALNEKQLKSVLALINTATDQTAAG